jgi:DNA helicase II / ATP-dependent DNA helicase PcrA
MPTRLPLTAEQQQAAATTAAHAFIVAAPGAGKTTVAAERFGVARYLASRPGLRTLGASFARSATQELLQRVRGRWGTHATCWPNDVKTLDGIHCELVRHLLTTGILRWPGGRTELTVLDTWRGQAGARYLIPGQGWHQVVTVQGNDIISIGQVIRDAGYRIGTKAAFESHLTAGVCTHAEIRAVLREILRSNELRPMLGDYLRSTTSSLIVDEVFDADELDVALILLAGRSGIPTTLIGDPWQALYEFRGARPELVPWLVERESYKTFPVLHSFRFITPEMQHLAVELRAGHGVEVASGSTAYVDVVLASEWDMLWQTDARVLPVSFGRINNQTDAAIVLLLDQVVTAHFGHPALFAQEAMTLLGLDPETIRAEGAARLRPVLQTLGAATPQATARAIEQLRRALRNLGSPRRLRTLPAASEEQQQARLHALALRLNDRSCIPGMTIHQAKGREWNAVGVRLKRTQVERLSSGLTQASSDDRAIYVALTRARQVALLV